MNKIYMNRIQKQAYELIKDDARAILTLVELQKNNKLDSNYICMSIQYIAIFTYEFNKWAKVLNLKIPQFTKEHKEYYEKIRLKNKLLEMGYDQVSDLLKEALKKSDEYFSNKCHPLSKVFKLYNNIGVDIIKDKYCGNTVLCDIYNPFINEDYSNGVLNKHMGIICGRLVGNIIKDDFKVLEYSREIETNSKDFNFYRNIPLKSRNIDSLVLFSILCSINFIVEFVDKIFIEDTTTKLRWGYLQYFYLVDFIKEINGRCKIKLEVDDKLYDKKFRNCMAHYGLGVILNEESIIENEKFGGITQILFELTYVQTKEFIFGELRRVSKQIEELILR